MRGWITAVLVIVFMAGMTTFYLLFTSAQSPLEEREIEAIEFARQHTTFQEIEQMEHFHGTRSYQVIDTQNEQGEDIFIWVEERFEVDEPVINDDFEPDIEQDDEEPRRLIIRRHSEGISKEDVNAHIRDHLEIDRLNHVKLGMIGRTPIYEVNYISTEGRQSYYYVTFEDGRYIRHYQF
ncbi:cell wall elongation regulator TseB-like domain-containing protein [Salisediminibacterium beveridgei]|uniref:Cell wall elongation regulator TseB-like domain-containing protein n=1 Tax=Salisediminibacterium beveridgei TaxID=632773 RepID=A0A1D7QV29_9BACI|nr:DUF5590 domain-containing protein [Salisediminibacterium beveridgei]AOM82839.1 hypothetical protein BBEV_1476 [Salisediminibacterium beveridgei]